MESKFTDEDTIPPKFYRELDITDSETDTNVQTFSGNKVIEELEIVTGNVVVKGGDLTIYGTVDGDVLVVGGDLHLKRTGKISGNARVINGSILKEDGAIIKGYEDKTNAEKASYRESRRKFSRSGRIFDVPWLDERINLDNFIFRYNRVESIFLGCRYREEILLGWCTKLERVRFYRLGFQVVHVAGEFGVGTAICDSLE